MLILTLKGHPPTKLRLEFPLHMVAHSWELPWGEEEREEEREGDCWEGEWDGEGQELR